MHLQPATHYRIAGYAHDTPPSWQHRLLALGLLPGAHITVERIAPLGDPVQIRAGYTSLMLRHKDLNHLHLDLIEAE